MKLMSIRTRRIRKELKEWTSIISLYAIVFMSLPNLLLKLHKSYISKM